MRSRFKLSTIRKKIRLHSHRCRVFTHTHTTKHINALKAFLNLFLQTSTNGFILLLSFSLENEDVFSSRGRVERLHVCMWPSSVGYFNIETWHYRVVMKTPSHLTWNRPQLLSRNSSHATADGQSSETHMNCQAVYRLAWYLWSSSGYYHIWKCRICILSEPFFGLMYELVMLWKCCSSNRILQLDLIAPSKFITLLTHLNRVRSSARLLFS